MVKISDHGRHVMSSSVVPPKTHREGERCTLNLSRAQTSSRWCGVIVRREGGSSGVVPVTRPWFEITRSVTKSPLVAKHSATLIFTHSPERSLRAIRIKCEVASLFYTNVFDGKRN
ncbi:uncharacterized protein TNCV_1464741 [Trichonephila clavipes]|nr:uncharacterized protein TNCV_1464741 [Trichonephila clavipes]